MRSYLLCERSSNKMDSYCETDKAIISFLIFTLIPLICFLMLKLGAANFAESRLRLDFENMRKRLEKKSALLSKAEEMLEEETWLLGKEKENVFFLKQKLREQMHKTHDMKEQQSLETKKASVIPRKTKNVQDFSGAVRTTSIVVSTENSSKGNKSYDVTVLDGVFPPTNFEVSVLIGFDEETVGKTIADIEENICIVECSKGYAMAHGGDKLVVYKIPA